MSIPSKLANKIEDFLYERSLSDGGYAPVGKQDLEKLAEIISLIMEAKYEADPDGDLPVNFELFDRTKYRRDHFSPLPHLHHVEGDVKTLMRALRLATSNLETAQDQVKSVTRQIEYSLSERMEQGKVVGYGDNVYEKHVPGINSRQELVEKLSAALEEQMKLNPLSGEIIEDFTQKKQWESKVEKALTEDLNTAISVSVNQPFRNTEDGVKVLARLVGLAYGEQEKMLGAVVKVPEQTKPRSPSP